MQTVTTNMQEPKTAAQTLQAIAAEKVAYPISHSSIDGYRAELQKAKPELEVLGWHARSERLRRF